jgi:uncharacterized membrane protein
MPTPRFQSIDVLRGIAIVAMVAYHALWDLAYYRLIEAGIGTSPAWVISQRSIVTAFLLLAGAGLWLAHGHGINWRGFWKRQALLVAAALGVTAVTWFQFGADYLSYFGVLHAIALFSLLALPLLRAPVWLVLAVAALVLGLPAVVSHDMFNAKALSWIGFFTETPETADLVPVFPWFGVVLLGMVGMRLAANWEALQWRSGALPVRALARLGRWSLVIYLVHQPVLFGIITPIAGWVNAQSETRIARFIESCEAGCGEAGNGAPYCTRYCQCGLELVVRDNLWDAPEAELASVAQLCTAMNAP